MPDQFLKVKRINLVTSWNLDVDPTPGEFVHWMHKEMETSKKKAKYTIPWLLLSEMAKMKVKESTESGLDNRPSSDFSWSELPPRASVAETVENTLTPSGHQEGSQCEGRTKPRDC